MVRYGLARKDTRSGLEIHIVPTLFRVDGGIARHRILCMRPSLDQSLAGLPDALYLFAGLTIAERLEVDHVEIRPDKILTALSR